MLSYELTRDHPLSDQLQRLASRLEECLRDLSSDQDSESPRTLLLSNLTLCPGIDLSLQDHKSFPGLMIVYDNIAEKWLALPKEALVLGGLAKFNIARKLAIELCLGSIGVSLCNKTVQEDPSTPEPNDIVLPILSRIYDPPQGDPRIPSSHIRHSLSHDNGSNLPAPAQKPKLHSQESSSSGGPVDDPAVLRLRQYVASAKTPPTLGSSTLLSGWPASPGSDPSEYVWRGVQEDLAGAERNLARLKRRQEARSQKTARNFLERGNIVAEHSLSQPLSGSFRNQGDGRKHAASSQPIEELPMTQPDRGLFGSRAQLVVRRPKKRRAAGF